MTITWFVVRGSGIAAYLMLAAATLWGLLTSTKVLGRAVKMKGMAWFHESVGLASVLATGVHLGALALDDYIEFGPRELLVPGAATWEPVGVAMGVMAFYGAALVSFSFYLKSLIGQRAWRTIHFMAFGTFIAATAHGVMVGTDSGSPFAFGMYVGFSVAVGLLLVVRVVVAHSPAAPAARVPAAAVVTRSAD